MSGVGPGRRRITVVATLALALGFDLLAASETAAPERTPDPFLGTPRARILLLGTFHFKDPGLDDYKPKHHVNIQSEKRQAEIVALIDRLAAFAPTKIAVEWQAEHQERADDLYRRYRAGEYELESNEIFQIGFRLAARLDHDRVYAVDARARAYEPWVDLDEYAAAHGQEPMRESPWFERFEKMHAHEDALKMEMTLRDFFLYLNDPDRVMRNHGQYLVGGFRVGAGTEYPGVDNRTRWYNRNLRIFANLQRITQRDDERILVLIGAGHLPILRHAVEASPEYRLVEVDEVLGTGD